MTFFTRNTLEGFPRASCSRFPKKFPLTSQKVAQKFLKKKSKVASWTLRPRSALAGERGEDLAPFSQKIHKLSTKTLWSMETRSILSTKSCSRYFRIGRKLEKIAQNAKRCSKYWKLSKSYWAAYGKPQLGFAQAETKKKQSERAWTFWHFNV